MDRFGEALDAFLRFDLRADSWVAYAVFVISSGVAGLAIVLLDACSVALKKDSYLGLTHGWRATPKNALVWMAASMIGSGLGLMARVFQPTPLAAVLAALTWRTLLAQLRRLSSHHVEHPPGGEYNMSVLGAVIDRILDAVSQRAFWTATQITAFVRDHNAKRVEKRYGRAEQAVSAAQSNDVRATRIFVSDQQQDWLVVLSKMAYYIRDDRRYEKPSIETWGNVANLLPVEVDENWSATVGVLHFGNRSRGRYYSKELFTDEPAEVAVSRFLSGIEDKEILKCR